MKLELESNLTYLPPSDNGMETEQLFACNVCQRTFLQIDDLKNTTRITCFLV